MFASWIKCQTLTSCGGQRDNKMLVLYHIDPRAPLGIISEQRTRNRSWAWLAMLLKKKCLIKTLYRITQRLLQKLKVQKMYHGGQWTLTCKSLSEASPFWEYSWETVACFHEYLWDTTLGIVMVHTSVSKSRSEPLTLWENSWVIILKSYAT